MQDNISSQKTNIINTSKRIISKYLILVNYFLICIVYVSVLLLQDPIFLTTFLKKIWQNYKKYATSLFRTAQKCKKYIVSLLKNVSQSCKKYTSSFLKKISQCYKKSCKENRLSSKKTRESHSGNSELNKKIKRYLLFIFTQLCAQAVCLEAISKVSQYDLKEGLKTLTTGKKHFRFPTEKFLLYLYLFLNNKFSQNPVNEGNSQRNKIIFHLPVWGESYCHKAIHYLFPSMLTDNNIKRLSMSHDIIFLVHCDNATLKKLRTSLVIQELQHYACFQFEMIPNNVMKNYWFCMKFPFFNSASAWMKNFRYLLLGGLQNHALFLGIQLKAHLVFLMPDIVLSDSFLTTLINKIDNKIMVLTTTTRTNFQDVSPHLKTYYTNSSKTSLSISSQDLTNLQVAHLHPCEWGSVISNQIKDLILSARFIFKTPKGFIIRALHYHPMIMNCERLNKSIHYNFLPIDDSMLKNMLSADLSFSEQLYVHSDAATMSIMELTDLNDEKLKRCSLFHKNYTYKEAIKAVQDMIELGAAVYDTPINRYLASFRHEYNATDHTNHYEDFIDDQHFFDCIHKIRLCTEESVV